MRFLIVLAVAGCAWTQPALRLARFAPGPDGVPRGWTKWAPRAEIAPRAWVDETGGRTGAGALALSGNSNPAAYGGWEYTVSDIRPGAWYRFTAGYRAAGLTYERTQVIARLEWTGAGGKRAGQPEFPYLTAREGEWARLTMEAPAPEGARAAKIQLWLANAPQATVWWDDISLDPIAAPKPRPVVVASVNLYPRKTGSARESVRQFLDLVESKAPARTDVILLPEGITVVGTGKTDAEVAETIPGPTTAALAATARRRNTYIAAGIYEREGSTIYNTAVLIDRRGNLAGKYRKVYLPREEFEAGLTPGADYPVFETDFGRVGLMICYDVFYADPARALAVGGAELILMPIWGGPMPLARARALENHVFLAASGYNHPTYVLDPTGEQVAAAPERGTVAIATIDLARRYTDPWLGWMRARYFKELRFDVPVQKH